MEKELRPSKENPIWNEEIKKAFSQVKAHHPEYTMTEKEAISFAVRFIPLVVNRLSSNITRV